MYYINNIDELTVAKVIKIISKFRGNELPKLRRYRDYYKGQQDILYKVATDVSKPNNQLVCNYCYDIVENYSGYIGGIPISYSSDEDITDIMNILRYNDYHNEDNEWLKNALIYGVSYELNYLDEEAQQRFKILDSEQCIPVYSNDLNEDLLAVIRFYSANDIEDVYKGFIDVYTAAGIFHYKSEQSYTTMELISEMPHYYGQVPITVFYLNSDRCSVFDRIITLQDAYNKLISAHTDDYEAFVDAYMVLKGVSADEDDYAAMKQSRILLLDNDDTAEYLTKQGDTSVINGLLTELNNQIQKIAKCPDFNDEKFLAQSGIAIRFKMCGMENNAANIEANMRKALQRRLELICAIQRLTADDFVWRDIQIIFTRNLPVNELEQAQLVNQLRGVVSTKTLLAQLSFVQDVDLELAQLEEEGLGVGSIFSFDNIGGSDEYSDITNN